MFGKLPFVFPFRVIVIYTTVVFTTCSNHLSVLTNETGALGMWRHVNIRIVTSPLYWFYLQDLTLTITSERSEADIELEEDSSEISSINVQSFVDEQVLIYDVKEQLTCKCHFKTLCHMAQEWKLHSHVDTWKRLTTRIYENSKYKHPAISTSCRASRRPGFYIYNIFLVMVWKIFHLVTLLFWFQNDVTASVYSCSSAV